MICNSFRNVCILLCPELPNMFSESSPPLPWDGEHNYARDAVEVYYEVSHFTLGCDFVDILLSLV